MAKSVVTEQVLRQRILDLYVTSPAGSDRPEHYYKWKAFIAAVINDVQGEPNASGFFNAIDQHYGFVVVFLNLLIDFIVQGSAMSDQEVYEAFLRHASGQPDPNQT